jgi:hypothetical protein
MSSTLLSTTPDVPSTHQNTVLADLVDAIATYPQTYLTIEIYDVDPPGTATGINEAEDVTFKVRVHNSGLPGADGVKLHGGAAFNPSLTSTPIGLVPGHMADGAWVDPPDGHYHFKAGDPSGGKVDLVRISINTWDADLDHPLRAHSDPVPSVEDTFAKTVLRA